MTEAATGPKERTFIENARRQQIVAAAIDTIAELVSRRHPSLASPSGSASARA